MKTTKIILTILTIIITLIVLIKTIVKSIDVTDIGMMVTFRDNTGYYIELNNDIKSLEG